MNQKLAKLSMEFGEALARLARVPKATVSNSRHKKVEKTVALGDNKPDAPQTRRAAGKRTAS